MATEDVEVQLEEPEKTISPDEGIEDLKRRLAEEQAARQQAEQRAHDAHNARQEAESRASLASTEVEDANLTLVNQAIALLRRENEVAKAALKAAYATQDWDSVAEAQEAISTNAAKLVQLDNGKAAMETRPKQVQQPAQRVISDPVEAIASQLAPRSAAWVRAHPDYARSKPLYQRMLAAHNLVVADGTIVPDTDAYFTAVEKALGIEAADDPTQAAAQVVGGRTASAPPAAPVTRGAANGQRTTVIRLTTDEREMAANMGMSEKEYATNKAALMAEGKLH